jgi:hypothetical protein
VSRLFAVAVKALVSLLVLATGFRAVSDDDFARVVIMQTFAHGPALDPTGTSWLPFPFWLNGGVMTLFGTSLFVARAAAFVAGLIAAWLLFEAAMILFADRNEALGAAILASILPWSARLGVATVPELPTAALAVFAAATLTRQEGRLRLIGAAALLPATLSRYEPWFVTAVFSALCLWDAREEKERAAKLAAAAIALLGPIGWMAHNALAHGDALHFLARVSAYKRALGGEGGLVAAITGYPLSLLREEPELCIASLSLIIYAKFKIKEPLPESLPRMALVALVLLLGLTAAALPGGAPTHHAGRALLTIWLVAALYVGAALYRARRLASKQRFYLGLALASVVIVGASVLRPWFARLDSWAHREAATSIGQQAAEHATARDSVLLEVRDYGYYAVQAGSGAPWLFVPDRSIDPRKDIRPSSFTDPERLRRRAMMFPWIVGYRSDITDAQLPEPVATAGEWGLWSGVEEPDG